MQSTRIVPEPVALHPYTTSGTGIRYASINRAWKGAHKIIYVTGDTHGELHRDKLDVEHWPRGQRLTRDDYVMVCGDFGGVFGPRERDEKILGWWESQPWTTLFVDGNHENHDALHAMEAEERDSTRLA